MKLIERIAEELARDSMRAEAMGDEDVVKNVSKALGDSALSLQEEYMSAIRFMRAEARARAVIDDALNARSLPTPDKT